MRASIRAELNAVSN